MLEPRHDQGLTVGGQRQRWRNNVIETSQWTSNPGGDAPGNAMPSQPLEPQRGRFGVAPGGLVLVQEFLNTAPVQGYCTDLLADVDLAAEWCAGAVSTWVKLRDVDAQPPSLNAADLAQLRDLRDAIAKVVNKSSPDSRQMRCVSSVYGAFSLSNPGVLRMEPTGSGWCWLASALFSEICLSQRDDTWKRIKQCHKSLCGTIFYDRSKNNSGRWCNVKTCGNAANLRASRARRRERQRAVPHDDRKPD
ncbi:CGNR zinc finger domain-containing protein [Mycobacterium sp. 1245805.9]|uniref:CGNR zinc finger domain-containing protein n=1 Tax=Mycobacterium sp. 1245805.9 TaxID=1856862 RepID=UPI003517E0A8